MLRVRRTLPATTDSVRQLRSLAVAYALENCEPDDQLVDDLALAVSEAATNVVQHAYHNLPEPAPVELDAYQTASDLILQIADHGGARRAATSTRLWPSHPQPDRHRTGQQSPRRHDSDHDVSLPAAERPRRLNSSAVTHSRAS